MKATFELEWMSPAALTHLANAASVEIDDCAMVREMSEGEHKDLRARFDAIVKELESRGETDLSSKILFPKFG